MAGNFDQMSFHDLDGAFETIPGSNHGLHSDFRITRNRPNLSSQEPEQSSFSWTMMADDSPWPRDDFVLDSILAGDSSQPFQPPSSDDCMIPTAGESSLDRASFETTESADLTGSEANNSEGLDHSVPPKIGKRFSSGSLKVLKTWLWGHIKHPYPTVGDIETMERQTGLSRPQIINWFANARRRTKAHPLRTPRTNTDTPPRRISRRGNSPAPVAHMSPMQRWQNSPPESEGANICAIARAVSGYSCHGESPHIAHPTNNGFEGQVGNGSSASSTGTSWSSGSSLSLAHSHTSQTSRTSLENLRRNTKRRRRRVPVNHRPKDTSISAWSQVCHTFQCTFCTETFKTKHNWERHEKSLHLSLEQWRCSPSGPTMENEKSETVCVYCGQVDPDWDHLMNHNYDACQRRQPQDRTFYRKDHLRQHLKLVHDADFMKWPMEQWKHEDHHIRSRCGFCGIVMRAWDDRVNHLAEHFKNGKAIADWQGDWGFDPDVLQMVENSMSPYLIHYERNSPWPFTTTQGLPETPVSAFELIQLELDYFAVNHLHTNHCPPSPQDLHYEACCIIFGADMRLPDPSSPAPSWLRDLLLLSSDDITKKARIRPMKSAAKSRITHLQISGKTDIFETCAMEALLLDHVSTPKLLDLPVGDHELQREACAIVHSMHALSPTPSDSFVSLLTSLISASTAWLAPFRRRADLPPAEISSPAPAAAPAVDGLASSDHVPMTSATSTAVTASPPRPADLSSRAPAIPFFLTTDENCYRRLARELSRFVASTMSARNPNCHVPSDEELQHQARWIMFDDDDPWNQTPADNGEWLGEFKREVGLVREGGGDTGEEGERGAAQV